MLFAILAIWFGYKKARDSGRNAPLWAAICGITFIGTQLLVSLIAGSVIGLGIAFFEWRETLYDDLTLPLTVVAIVASAGAVLIEFRYLDRVPDNRVEPPPPPPSFDIGDPS